MTNAYKIPTVEEERNCCNTARNTEMKEESMSSSLDHARGYLLASLAMLDQLNNYVFAAIPSESSSEDVPLGCLRDAVYNNEYLASLVEDKLKNLVDRICN